MSVLVKLSFNLKKLIECGILGQFVIKQLLQVRQHLPSADVLHVCQYPQPAAVLKEHFVSNPTQLGTGLLTRFKIRHN